MNIWHGTVIVVCEDQSVKVTGIEPGDLYMGKGINGWSLLTCSYVNTFARRTEVYPRQSHVYSHLASNCFVVKEVRDAF